MNNPNKINYFDLRLENKSGRLPTLIGRTEEVERLTRIVNSTLQNNCLLVGPSGIGKTTFIYGWFSQLSKNSDFRNVKFVQLDVENFHLLSSNPTLYSRYEEAFESISNSVVFIDNFGSLISNKNNFLTVKRLLFPLLENPSVKFILAIKSHELKSIQQEDPTWINFFETVTLKDQPLAEQISILKLWAHKLGFSAREPELSSIVKFVQRFGSLGQLPAASIKILDESISACKVLGFSEITSEQISKVVADKTGVPLNHLNADETKNLKKLETNLNSFIVGQNAPISFISSAVQRAKLGLKNPNRPLASFLMLGPSGVGKTETAKVLSQQVFGRKESFVRIDMSEFAQEHTVQRLIGAPPGYVGYDDGGVLTNAVKSEPYSLILLDEIEKAHSKVFDVFLQILDDGRLTSGKGETVDFSQTIIMATSNLAVEEILSSYNKGVDIQSAMFLKTQIMPLLTQAFRLEFINRFDKIVIFNPLSSSELIRIASLEIRKIEQRLADHKIKFKFDEKILENKIKDLVDSRFGARPVKRFVEELCESLVTKALLK